MWYCWTRNTTAIFTLSLFCCCTLCTGVNWVFRQQLLPIHMYSPTNDHWVKLWCNLEYLYGTIFTVLFIGAAHTTHPTTSLTSILFLLFTPICTSTLEASSCLALGWSSQNQQNENWVLKLHWYWLPPLHDFVLHFFKAHVYLLKNNTIKPELNGWKSCGTQSRCINICFFFLKDQLSTKHINLKYCQANPSKETFSVGFQGCNHGSFTPLLLKNFPFCLESWACWDLFPMKRFPSHRDGHIQAMDPMAQLTPHTYANMKKQDASCSTCDRN